MFALQLKQNNKQHGNTNDNNCDKQQDPKPSIIALIAVFGTRLTARFATRLATSTGTSSTTAGTTLRYTVASIAIIAVKDTAQLLQ